MISFHSYADITFKSTSDVSTEIYLWPTRIKVVLNLLHFLFFFFEYFSYCFILNLFGVARGAKGLQI